MVQTRPNVDFNPNLQRPSVISTRRAVFEDDYSRNGFKYVSDKYGNTGLRYKMKVVRRKSRTLMRKILKKIKNG